MRVFVPMTFPMLTALAEEGEVMPVSGTAFAVTVALRGDYEVGGDDELAEIAMDEAARASMRLLSALPGERRRRVVITADVSGVEERPDLDTAVVRVSGPIPLVDVASVHVDLEAAETDVERAVGVIDAADLGEEDAELAVEDAQDHPLAWYAPQELPFLLELL